MQRFCPFGVAAVNHELPQLGIICFAVASSLPRQELDHAIPAPLNPMGTITPMLPSATSSQLTIVRPVICVDGAEIGATLAVFRVD
jgi:hypothetical protein